MRKITFIFMTIVIAACTNKPDTGLLELTNGKITARFSSYGARLVSLEVPDKNGKALNIVWGFDNEQSYRNCATDPYYGAIIGRYGNRIANGKFTLNGKSYLLDLNDGPNSLHGGNSGFHNRNWTIASKADTSITFTYLSKDGEGGYPGKLNVSVVYTLSSDNSLHISYEATTDQPTVLNLTNHAYWNLNGPGKADILNHRLLIHADTYTPVDSTLIPTGVLASLSGTPFDFRQEHVIGERINNTNAQLRNGKGYDHNFVLNAHDKQQPVCEVTGDKSGIRMQVFTDQPGLQFYSGNFMAGKNVMNGGAKDIYRSGFCLETQHFPDSPNQPAFPSTELKPGETYKTITIYRFSHTPNESK